ncbi:MULTISPECIES: tail fiber assembly protein [Serratia]|uniref:Tail fiber assembly protein n=1 Tax=Serratia quinivorans TaxID=137545 RepID=A0A380AA26_9GAMM|nr:MULTISPECIES: tail fiber assembly protein [Serratia]RYM62596.1 hypothetical protein BSR03_09330 [Serratia proteamaculans]CAI1861644.1 Uncharacterised protein [Serratia quinivorans]SUI76705.1 Uncharacterised protein [Serratia quinivorans]
MKSYVYSAKNNAFYPISMKTVYQAAGSWPRDGKQIDDSVYLEFAATVPPAGMARITGENGLPAWVSVDN